MPPEAIRLVVFDWAGTIVDHGSMAPIAALLSAFAKLGVEVTEEEARGPMGLNKRDHIRVLLHMPAVAARWRQKFGREPAETDGDSIYESFLPLQLTQAMRRTALVPGVLECQQALRQRGIAIGTTTGYPRSIGDRVADAVRGEGFLPDVCLFPDDVSAGRPAPWMIFRMMEKTRVAPPAAVVKIGDTVPDIEEGRNAGAWSIGVTDTGSEIGLDIDAWRALAEADRERRAAAARATLLQAGAHAVVRSVADLPELIDELNLRLGRGERPS